METVMRQNKKTKWTARKVDMGPLGLAFEIIDPTGKVTGVMGGGSDVDLLKRVRSRLRELNRKA